MTWRNRWVVLVPGKVAWVEKRARELLEDYYDEKVDAFIVVPGEGRYQALVETGDWDHEPHRVLGDAFSREVDEPVYSIERREDNPDITCFLRGEESDVRREPEKLVRSLKCKVPWFDEPPPPPHKAPWVTVVLIQGLDESRVRTALARRYKHLRPGDFVITESPEGLLMRDDKGWLGMAMVDLALLHPRATIYTVRAMPDLEAMAITMRHKKDDATFTLPPGSGVTGFGGREVTEILGERTPERILAALGIPKEWFQMRDDLPAGVAPKPQGS